MKQISTSLRSLLLLLSLIITLFGTNTVSAQEADLAVSLWAPPEITYGHREYQMIATAENTTDAELAFDLTVSNEGAAWAPESYTYTPSVGSVTLWCSNYCKFRWTGTLSAHSTATFTFTVYSGFGLGNYPAGKIYRADTTEVLATASTVLVQGTQPPGGEFVLTTQPDWFPGQSSTMRLIITAPIATTFTATTSSDCGTMTFPGTIISPRWRTYFEYDFGNAVMPENFSGPCSITAHVTSPENGSWDIRVSVNVPTLTTGLTVPPTVHKARKFTVSWNASTSGTTDASMYIVIPEGLRIRSRESCYYYGCSLYADLQSFTGSANRSVELSALNEGVYTITYYFVGPSFMRTMTQTVEVTK